MVAKGFQVLIRCPEREITAKSVAVEALTAADFTLRDLVVSAFPDSGKNLSSISFNFNGKLVEGSSKMSGMKITPFSTLNLTCRLLGGGGDGGSTCAESRDCYLNMYAVKKPDKVDPNEMRLSKWLNCSLSNEPLKRPVVVDMLGNLFNKEALVEALLKKKVPKEFGYIKGLKDMVAVEMEMIPGVESGRKENGSPSVAKFRCPISGLEFNGKYRFFALKSCGHVVSAKALKEVKSSECLVCRKEFGEGDKIVINGSDEEVAVLQERMEEQRARLKEKKGRKVKNGEDGSLELLPKLSGTKHGIDSHVGDNKAVVNNSMVNGNGKVEMMKQPSKKFKAVDIAPANATKEIYASLFTSSSKKSNLRETYSCRSCIVFRERRGWMIKKWMMNAISDLLLSTMFFLFILLVLGYCKR